MAAAVTLALGLGPGAVPAAAQDVARHCPDADLLSDFEASSAPDQGFSTRIEQRGRVAMAADPDDPANAVASFTDDGKSGGKVGKAHLVHRFGPVGIGSRITMEARFYFPPGSFADSVILMDLECASCGLDTNPGVRLYLRDGRPRVDRSKIGIKDAFLPAPDARIGPGAWHWIAWKVTLGDDSNGSSQVYLDGVQVMDARGTTVLLQETVDRLADGLVVRSEMDRFQIGITANSNRKGTALLVDDVGFCIG